MIAIRIRVKIRIMRRSRRRIWSREASAIGVTKARYSSKVTFKIDKDYVYLG